ncbi:disintegrin and metalloproteinase domain-containing protein 30 isoform X2 [Panthera leo]|uniref:disintegrin and metalloproteinase domain-containing protein 30 isoform X2 n=1 Tax=Panthera leo TaxID=9689 RepID=UPI001C69D5EB|nr:disintegrin and metalloproteinase domain-containing protein 30 isoform X2 [Panthera leo]
MRSARTLRSPGRSLPVLVLVGLLAEALGEDLIFHPEWGFESYEIIIPKQLSFRGGQQGPVKQVSYLLQVKGQKYVLHLWPRRLLLPRNLKVFSFMEQGKLLEDHPYIPRDCYYIGLIEGNQDSEATFSTCTGGLRGILKIYDERHQMEPLKASSSFEHVMYLLKKENTFQNEACGLTNDELEKQMAQGENMARLRDFAESYSHQRYVETVMVFDHSRYIFLQSNATQIVHDAIPLAGIMDALFRDVSLRVHLKGIEIWTSGDRINIRQMNTSQILEAFLKYLRIHVSPQILADWTHLFVTTVFIHSLGWAYIGGACSTNSSGSVSSFRNLNILEASLWSAHELGHGLECNMIQKTVVVRESDRRMFNTQTGRNSTSYHWSSIIQGEKCQEPKQALPSPGNILRKRGHLIIAATLLMMATISRARTALSNVLNASCVFRYFHS